MLDTPFIHSISNHPVHMLDKNNNISPSAFIPFCSLAGNMSIVGAHMQGFDIPVCDIFRPTVLDGQLCYQVDLNPLKNQINPKQLKSHGFSFLMDYNRHRMGPDVNDRITDDTAEENISEEEDEEENVNEAMVHIETLGM